MTEQMPSAIQPITLHVKLIPVENSDRPIAANYTQAMSVQGIIYLDFGFIEPGALGLVARAAQDGKPLPKGLQGKLGARLSMSLDVATRLHRQLQELLDGMKGLRKPAPGAGPQAA